MRGYDYKDNITEDMTDLDDSPFTAKEMRVVVLLFLFLFMFIVASLMAWYDDNHPRQSTVEESGAASDVHCKTCQDNPYWDKCVAPPLGWGQIDLTGDFILGQGKIKQEGELRPLRTRQNP